MRSVNLVMFFLLAGLLLIVGCSDDSPTDPNFESNGGIPGMSLFDAAQEVAPSFAESGAKSEWDHGDPLYQLFNKFRVYNPAVHNGVIDGSNFFKALHTLDEEMGRMFESTGDIAPTVIQEPFEFGNSFEYDHAANAVYSDTPGEERKSGFAYRMDGDTIHFLIAYEYNENGGNQQTLGQLQGSYDPSSGLIDLAMVYLVDYGDSYYVVRNEISGNEITHEFEMRMANSSNNNWGATLVGKGISQGDDSYFLVKMNLGGGLVEDGERYYVLPTEADEAYLQALDRDGLTYEELPSSVSDVAADVQAMTTFLPADLPVGHADFNDGDIDLDFER